MCGRVYPGALGPAGRNEFTNRFRYFYRQMTSSVLFCEPQKWGRRYKKTKSKQSHRTNFPGNSWDWTFANLNCKPLKSSGELSFPGKKATPSWELGHILGEVTSAEAILCVHSSHQDQKGIKCKTNMRWRWGYNSPGIPRGFSHWERVGSVTRAQQKSPVIGVGMQWACPHSDHHMGLLKQ